MSFADKTKAAPTSTAPFSFSRHRRNRISPTTDHQPLPHSPHKKRQSVSSDRCISARLSLHQHLPSNTGAGRLVRVGLWAPHVPSALERQERAPRGTAGRPCNGFRARRLHECSRTSYCPSSRCCVCTCRWFFIR